MSGAAFDIYRANAATLAERYEQVDPQALYAIVADLMRDPQCRVADIGAGSGRDAAWLAGRGYEVVAVEPVAQFRADGQARHAEAGFEWLDDSLPELARLQDHPPFGMILMSGVWHHIAPPDRAVAMASIAANLAAGGIAILSLRHGSVDHDRGLYAADVTPTVALALDHGFTVVGQREADSVQPINQMADVRWTWLVLRRD